MQDEYCKADECKACYESIHVAISQVIILSYRTGNFNNRIIELV